MIDKWRIEENVFSEKTSGKHEALMTLGNGYMGIRAGFEEEYAGQKRGFFIAGTYNRAGLNEVAELPNAADITAFEIIIDNERFSLLKGKIHEYNFTLDMKTGELKIHGHGLHYLHGSKAPIFFIYISIHVLFLLYQISMYSKISSSICSLEINLLP